MAPTGARLKEFQSTRPRVGTRARWLLLLGPIAKARAMRVRIGLFLFVPTGVEGHSAPPCPPGRADDGDGLTLTHLAVDHHFLVPVLPDRVHLLRHCRKPSMHVYPASPSAAPRTERNSTAGSRSSVSDSNSRALSASSIAPNLRPSCGLSSCDVARPVSRQGPTGEETQPGNASREAEEGCRGALGLALTGPSSRSLPDTTVRASRDHR